MAPDGRPGPHWAIRPRRTILKGSSRLQKSSPCYGDVGPCSLVELDSNIRTDGAKITLAENNRDRTRSILRMSYCGSPRPFTRDVARHILSPRGLNRTGWEGVVENASGFSARSNRALGIIVRGKPGDRRLVDQLSNFRIERVRL